MKIILFSQFLILLGILPIIGKAQYVTVSGYITQFLTEIPIENATIFEINSGIGTISNNHGYYKLVLSPGAMNLTFSETDYQPFSEEIKVLNDTIIMIQLKPEKWNKNKLELELQSNTDGQQKKSKSKNKFLFF